MLTMTVSKYMLLALLAGCAGMIKPPADWPELRIVTIVAPAAEMLQACTRDGVLLSDVACALIDFDRKRCSIIFRDDKPILAPVMAHEIDHCRGKDHPGEDTLRRAWEKWQTR